MTTVGQVGQVADSEASLQALRARVVELRQDNKLLDQQVEQAERLAAATQAFSQQQNTARAAASRHVQQVAAAQTARACKGLKESDQQQAAGFAQIQDAAAKIRTASGARALALASSHASFVSSEEQHLEHLKSLMQPASSGQPGIQVTFIW